MAKKKQDLINGTFREKKRNLKKIMAFGDGRISGKTLENMKACGSFMEFIATVDKEKKKMVHGMFCKNRFCPVCAYRKARKDSYMLSIMMEAIQAEKGYEYIFMTLTTPNVPADKLSEEIDRFNKALSKLFRRKRVTTSIKGYVRKLEITYNKSRNDYNPHFHLIMAVPKHYFKMKGYYIKQSEWLDMWRDVTGLDGINEDGTDEICSLDVRKVNGYRQEKAVSEIAKYSAKDFEITYSQDVFDTFYFAMKGRQLMTFNGVFKEYRKKYESGELDHYKKKDENDYFWFLTASWMQKDANYSVAVRELTDDEKKFFAERYDKEGDETG
ncbi:replication protein [Enterococcus faecium]|jgi:plasmid rolling circle replication initiator protein Rep|nr:protein rep [Enterococcus faecium]HAQ1376152.1 protein rep [Enterococcus faecium Ef_aus0080]HAQ1583911.1 protein rep [Enterococcus faecium Efm-HS0661]MCH3578018.1 protein rep [Enterococcus faecium]MCZ1515416.1 replication protein [Enterococcus faecium]MDN6945806.1 replication protein [Enterococcus faecium]